ncbi:MAG: response regulator [Pleurocapsa sp.]
MDTKQDFKTKDIVSIPNHLILVVEDDEDNQLLLQYAISMFGWEYIFAINALDAIKMARVKQPDIILLDIVMPNIDGFQTASLLKNNIYTQNIPLIAVTGLVGREEKNLIFATGFYGYLSKPFALDDLHNAIVSNIVIN